MIQLVFGHKGPRLPVQLQAIRAFAIQSVHVADNHFPVLVGPIAAAVKKDTRNLAGVKHKMTRCGRGGLVLGVFMGPFMTYMKIRKEEDPYKIWDRCYRLRHNRGQILVDQSSVVGGVGGAAIGAATSSGALFGGLVGMSSGILAAAVYNNVLKKKD